MTEWRKANREKARAYDNEYMRKRRAKERLENPPKSRACNCGKPRCPAAIKFTQHLFYAANKTEMISKAAARPAEITKIYKKRWKDKNPAKVLMHGRFRKRNLKQAAPPWLTDEQWSQMDSIYAEAKRLSAETGVSYHVDHIVPLRGGTVSGLHVPWNLRVMEAEKNMKRSRHWS